MAVTLSGIAGFQQGVNAYQQAANRVVDKLANQPPVRSIAPNGQDTAGVAGLSESGFGSVLDRLVSSTSDTIARGEMLANKSLVGKAQLSEVVTAVSQAEVAMQTVMALRDRVISAYQEILKMPI